MKVLFLILGLVCGGTAFGQDALMGLINKKRASLKITQLSQSSKLICAAKRHALDIGARRSCTHTGKDGSRFSQRIADCGYRMRRGGEIVACGQTTPEKALEGWMNSPGHRAILTDSAYRDFGCYMSRNYWVCVFGLSMN